MLALLDSTVFIDLVGDSSAEKHASEHLLGAAVAGKFDVVVAVGSLQEVLHVLTRRRNEPRAAVEVATWVAKTFRIAGHRPDDVSRLVELFEKHPTLGAADALICSAAEREGADVVVTRDRGFGRALGTRWVDPMDADSLARLLDQ